ncbi:MAG: endonuclease/exonuclease/phosphatase family protein [Actinomycetota bacterium]
MRALTWNIWWQFGPWQERQPAIQAELAAVDADVVLLQEVWATDDHGDQAERLAAPLGYHVERTTKPDGSPHAFGNAILSRWPMTRREQITLSGPDGGPSHRSALAATVAAPTGEWLVVTTHLAWQYDQSALRSRQLQEVVDLAVRHRSAEPDHPPVILGGDLNAVPESDEVRRLTGLAPPYTDGLVFTDCWAAVGDGDGDTWTRDNPHSSEALWPRRRLDYVFVTWPRPKPLGNPVRARLVGCAAHGGMVPSDHYGVVVDFDDRPPRQERR